MRLLLLQFSALSFPSTPPLEAAAAGPLRSLLALRRPAAALRLLPSLPFPPDDPTLLSLVSALSRSRNPLATALIPDLLRPHVPSLKVFNSILDTLVKDDIDSARQFFRQKMVMRGVHADERTFGILMKGLCRTNRINEGFRLLKLMKDRNFQPNAVIYNTLIHALCRNGKVGRARSLFGQMDCCPSEVTFNILISAYCGEGNLVQALVMLEKSFDLGLVPDAISVTKIVEVLCSHGRAMEAVEILERVEKRGGSVDAVSYNTLIKGFCGMEKPQVGRRVLKEMERKGVLPTVRTYNTLIKGFCDSGKLDSALDLFEEMRSDGVSPKFETFDMLIQGLCVGGRVKDCLKILELMEEHGGLNFARISPYNSVIYGLYKEGRGEEACKFLKSKRMSSIFPRAVDRSWRILDLCMEGKVDEAKMVYKQMVGEGGAPCVLVYVSLIEGFCRQQNMREAFDLMNEMVEKGYFPAVSTFDALIHGFCEEGKLKSGLKLLDEMISRECSPTSSSYGPLIGALCRQGDLEKAFSLLAQMVGKGLIPDQYTWNSLLMSETLKMKNKSWNMISDVVCTCRS